MGLFSDRCENADCSARVKKGARYCSRCGWAGPNSLVACPDCGKKVGRTSRFCWSCGADLEAGRRPRIVHNRWVRDEEEFAVRVEAGDVEGFLKRTVTVEPGTVGLVLSNGRIKKDVEWGTQTLDRLLSPREARSIILVSTRDALVRPTFEKVRDRDYIELDVTVQAVLRADPERYEGLVQHFLEGGTQRVTFAALEQAIAQELRDIVSGQVCAHSLGEMAGNAEWQEQFEANLRDAISVHFGPRGLEVAHVSFVDFGGARYEAYCKERGEVGQANLAADYLEGKNAVRKRLAQLEGQGDLDAFLTEEGFADQRADAAQQFKVKGLMRDAELQETIEQTRQEMMLKRRLREIEIEDLDQERAAEVKELERQLEQRGQAHQDEMAMMVLIAQQKRGATEGEFRREQERLQDQHELERARQRGEHDRREERAGALQRYELLVKESEANLKVSLDNLKVAEVEQEQKKDYERHRLQIHEAMQRLADERLKTILEYKRDVKLAKIQADRDVATSEDRVQAKVAEAVSTEKDARLDDMRDAMKQQQQQHDRALQFGERVVDSATRGQGRGSGAPAGGAGAAAGAEETVVCKNCGNAIPVTQRFCGECGYDRYS